jgi:hypothetical protein
LSLVAATVAAATSLWGLLDPDLYARDPAIIAPQLVGQDLVTLLLALPVLSVSAWLAHRGSPRAVIAQYGLLVYLAYTYATYAFGARFNVLFLAYCAILGVSTYALFLATPPLLATSRAIDFDKLPRRMLIGILYGIAAIFTLLWGLDIVTAMLTGEPPRGAIEAETPTSFVHVLDLSFVLPLGAIAATLLLLRREAGGPLAGVFLVKAMSIALAVLSMAAFTALAGQAVNVPVAAAMGIVVLSVGLVGWCYSRAFAPRAAPAVRGAPRRPTA